MTITWLAPKAAEAYTLIWDTGASKGKIDQVILADTTVLTHTVAGLDPAKDYRFAVRGQNKCGNGEYSDIIVGSTKTVPMPMTAVKTVATAACSIQISWTAPANGGRPIKFYTI
jgi:phosphodiesterase/alkaline phosphatase D-like protein